jgi:hypothetical protein
MRRHERTPLGRPELGKVFFNASAAHPATVPMQAIGLPTRIVIVWIRIIEADKPVPEVMTHAMVMHRAEAHAAAVCQGCASKMSYRNMCSADRSADASTTRRAGSHMAKTKAAAAEMRAATTEVHATAAEMHPAAEAAAHVHSAAASKMATAASSKVSTAASTTASERLGCDRSAPQ